jgi:hypothetical protein
MSIHSVGLLESASWQSLFLLGRNSTGWWVIRETTGRKAGIFRTRAAAIKFARDESVDGVFTIVDQFDGLEFEPPLQKRAA